MNPIPIILDTDIGDDIDDALALAVALNSPEFDVRGITTVFAHAPRRAQLVRHILKAYGRSEIPIAPGCSMPLLQSLEHIAITDTIGAQFEVLTDEVLEVGLPHAIDFMAQAIDVTAEPDSDTSPIIVAIGALTNVALALAREPELIARCRIVLMGGQWMSPEPEWNIGCDPEAAAMVFSSGADISMVGYDITQRCQLSDAQMAAFAQRGTPQCDLLAELIRLWHAGQQRPITLHDPLTLLTLIDDCVAFEEKCIEVKLCGDDRGNTVVVEGTPNVRVAVDVDIERAVGVFMERVLG